MKILGIESSCDETAAAVVEDGVKVLSNVVVSQIDIHKAYGGVVPEVAARSHIEAIIPVIDEAVVIASEAKQSKELNTVDATIASTTASRRAFLGANKKLNKISANSGKARAADVVEATEAPTQTEFGADPWDEIDAIAVANTPGLMGSLLVGTLTARTLALIKNKPLYPVNHIEAHVYANFLQKPAEAISMKQEVKSTKHEARITNQERNAANRDSYFLRRNSMPKFPILALVVSGGHTQIMLFHNHGDFEILGQTRDDAVGEAFDKVAKILGLPYPGGPSISQWAKKGDPNKYKLPKPVVKASIAGWKVGPETSGSFRTLRPGRPSVDFSFSGLKTALLRAVQADCGKDYTFPSNELKTLLNASQKHDFAASFQKTACEILTDKLLQAYDGHKPKTVVVAGGVAANQELRRQIKQRLPIEAHFPAPEFCTDNAAMVASLGYFKSLKNMPTDPHDLEVIPTS